MLEIWGTLYFQFLDTYMGGYVVKTSIKILGGGI